VPAGKYIDKLDYNRALLLEQLRYHEIKRLVVSFSGSNDSGSCDIAEIISLDDERLKCEILNVVTVPTAKMSTQFEFGGKERDWTVKPATLTELVYEVCEEELERSHGGWEINAGFFGRDCLRASAHFEKRETMCVECWQNDDDYDYENRRIQRRVTMSVAGKKKDEWVAATYCDFGTPGRKDAISHHFSIAAAVRRYNVLNKVYGRNDWRCWQEDRAGVFLQGEQPKEIARA
jgi:hypothetical protein